MTFTTPRHTQNNRPIDQENQSGSSSFQPDQLSKEELDLLLCQSLENDEIKVFYQPIFDAVSGKVISAEALARWYHPEYGVISPGIFVPAMEEYGLISRLDLRVVDRTRKFLLHRRQRNLSLVPIAVNISRMDFHNDEIIAAARSWIAQADNLKDLLRVEVTESSVSVLTHETLHLLRLLQQSGIQILIDDFGSGYSSFATLEDFDFNFIKLDISFVQKIGKGPKAEILIQTIISLAHRLHAQVIAEGVETEEQVRFLRDNGCDFLQGYYFSKPLSQRDFCELLNHSVKTGSRWLHHA